MVFSSEGVSPDPEKVSAVQQMQIPQNVSKLRSFLGMNYCGRFIPDYATVSEPLLRLTKKDEEWQWSAEQDSAFTKLKHMLIDRAVMTYYDPGKEIIIIVDASQVGLGAMLVQDQHIVAYGTWSLTATEFR